ncbi:MAG: histidine phosphatase family protein [Bryobacterales bacterium]|nr:histidine phosphatase family protein [Bryobacterales bacterium]
MPDCGALPALALSYDGILSTLYFIRHGQAGPRNSYDALSEIGREQGRLLGRYLASQDLLFSSAVCGGLVRQRDTAALVSEAYAGAGIPFPPVVEDVRWNEFDLDAVYREIAPQIALEDAEFRREYEAIVLASSDPSNSVHRTWNRCDIAVVRAWIEGRFASVSESWEEFQVRVRSPLPELCAAGPGEALAIFTSATPIAIWAALALELGPRAIMRLAGVSYNTCLTTLRLNHGELSLFTFNGTPHLTERSQRTFR